MRTLIFIFFFFIGLAPSIIFAAPSPAFLPDTVIQHEAVSHFAAAVRLLLDAEFNDTKGIVETRCYFKTGFDENYLFVSMEQLSETGYQCSLPAFKAGSHTLEYFFLIVNAAGQVVRTNPYVLEEDGDNAAPHASGDSATVLHVRSELGYIARDYTGISDSQVVLEPVQDVNGLYGLRAGIYEITIIPDLFNVMPGYFGGFVFDRIDNTIRPIKGFAPNLSQSLLESISPMDMQENTADVQMQYSEVPDIGGGNWAGYFTNTLITTREPLTASIIQAGRDVTIVTTLTGLGHELIGTINSKGDMLLYDSYDGEDWTTHYGPATSISVNIYDYVYPAPKGETEAPLNVIILNRLPLPPLGVQASDGLFLDEIAVSWDQSDLATYYVVYACSTSLTDSCIALSQTNANQYVDIRKVIGTVYFRIQACNEFGCYEEFSDFDIGSNQLISIVPILHLLKSS